MSILRILTAILSPALLLGLGGCHSSSSPPSILYGHIASLRDSNGSAQRGIRLAVDQADKDLAHATGRRVKVLHADPQGKLETLEAEAVRFVVVNRVQALLGGATAEELERLDRARAVVLSPCGLRPPALSDNVFCTGLAPAFMGQVLARFAREELKLAKVDIVLDERREEYRQLADSFARAWSSVKGATPVRTLRFGKEAKFADLAKRLKEDVPAAVLFVGAVEDLRSWRQALENQSKPETPARTAPLPVLFGGPESSLQALQGERETRSGVYLVTAFVKEGGTPRMQKFAAKYLDMFQEEPNARAALAYDNAQLLFEAQRRSGDSGKTLREELAALKDFASWSGPLGFDAQQCTQRPAFVVKLEDGKARTVKRYEASPGN